MSDDQIKTSIIVASVTGAVHAVWEMLGLPCIYPKVRAWFKRKHVIITERFK
jgi:hypothetical protein